VTARALPAPGRGRRRPAADRLRLRLDPLRMLVCLLIILVVSRLHQYVPALAQVRPLLIITVLSSIYAFSNPRLLIHESVFSTWPARAMAGLGIMAVLAVPFGISMGNSGKFVLDVYWKTILMAFLIIASCRSARDLYAYAWSYVIGALILSYLALFFFDLQRYGSDFSYARLAGLASWDANDVVLVLMPALACTLLVLQVASGRGKILALMALIGIGATVARSGSRGGLIGLISVGVGLLFLGRGVALSKRVVTILVVAAGLALWAPHGYWRQMESILHPTDDYNYTSKDGRKQVGRRGIGYMLARPVFGLGINNFEKAECSISEKALNTPAGYGIRCTPPHNSFVQAGAELGIPGLLLWSSIPLFGIISLVRLGRRLPYRWRRGTREERFLRMACPYFAVALIGFTATCFFLNFAWLEPYYVLGAFVAALMGVITRRVAEQRMELHAAAMLGNRLHEEAAAMQGRPVPMLPGQARYPRPLVMLPTARLRPGDVSSW
jgi:O-antigen ligase